MDITIENCNNIDAGKLCITENRLNIKYAINGTGKSTISKAITSQIQDTTQNTKTLVKLKPFKQLGVDENNPQIFGIENIKMVKVFDEEYVDKYIFHPDELIQGSFDIFIRDNARVQLASATPPYFAKTSDGVL